MKFIALALFLPLCAALNVTARRYVLAENASKFYTELDNRHENVTLSIDPHATRHPFSAELCRHLHTRGLAAARRARASRTGRHF